MTRPIGNNLINVDNFNDNLTSQHPTDQKNSNVQMIFRNHFQVFNLLSYYLHQH